MKKAATIDSGDSVGLHYSSLQCVQIENRKIENFQATHLTTTDSGSICINGTAVTKLLSKLGPMDDSPTCQPNRHILNFDESNTQIALEWNAQHQHQLILRHISGDASRYKNLCRELISTII